MDDDLYEIERHSYVRRIEFSHLCQAIRVVLDLIFRRGAERAGRPVVWAMETVEILRGRSL
jgi:hypothetical protein